MNDRRGLYIDDFMKIKVNNTNHMTQIEIIIQVKSLLNIFGIAMARQLQNLFDWILMRSNHIDLMDWIWIYHKILTSRKNRHVFFIKYGWNSQAINLMVEHERDLFVWPLRISIFKIFLFFYSFDMHTHMGQYTFPGLFTYILEIPEIVIYISVSITIR